MTPGAAAAKPDNPLVEFRPAADNGPRWGAAPYAPTCLPPDVAATFTDRTAPRRTDRTPAARFWPGARFPSVRRPAGRFTAHA